MRLGLISPRYGPGIVGGTEHWLRMLCEHMASLRGWDVEVFTTCATSAVTWGDDLPAGDSVINGVQVHRFASVSGRNPTYGPIDRLVRTAPDELPPALVRKFVTAVGPVNPDLIEAAEASRCQLVAVTPYLFWPAFAAAAVLGRRVLFHPAAHDEAELAFPLTRRMFAAVGGFAYNSHAERHLAERRFPILDRPGSVIGCTVNEHEGDPDEARRWLGLGPDEPFVLCLGRVERGKGAHTLAELWRLYRRRRPLAPRLVMLGTVNEALAGDRDVLVPGGCTEEVKWGALRAATVLVTPSAWESFSLVVLEAWLTQTPVVVNGRCDATVEHCERGRGGLSFDGYADFEVIMDRLLADGDLRATLATNGETYARDTFAWSRIVDRYETLTDRVLEHTGS